ncbi:MAG TPA: alpha/beta hydrolase-fold protein [Caulobacteraceae bacterium]|nr:alpha/beta hydrolase-fold protein [Caulobacteraceae bacterium]
MTNALGKLSLAALLAAGLAGGALAQDAKAPAHDPQQSERPEIIVSPDIGANGQVTFRIKAAKASEVLLNASVGEKAPKPPGTVKESPGQWNIPMQKGPGGVWSVTLTLEPEVYRYAFLVDGMRALDQQNPDIKARGTTPWSYFEVPGNPARFDEWRDVPHGAVQTRSYRVGGSGPVHRVVIYTPPGYEAHPTKKYPVLYLFHGGGDSEEGWSKIGKAGEIEENLLAEHKAVPMVIVMPYGDIPGDATALPAIETFGQELFNDVMPMVEKTYHVRTDRDGRAIGGVSMGAGQAFTLGLRHMDKFAWVTEFSVGAFLSPKFDMDNQVPGFLENAKADNRKLKLLFLGVGTEDTRYPGLVKVDKLLTQAGIHHEMHTTPGEHEWKVWRHLLVLAMPKLFQPAK